jgi:hypothetical protein
MWVPRIYFMRSDNCEVQAVFKSSASLPAGKKGTEESCQYSIMICVAVLFTEAQRGEKSMLIGYLFNLLIDFVGAASIAAPRRRRVRSSP